MEEADRIGVALLLGPVAFDIRRTADAVTLQAPVKRRAGEPGDRRLESVQAGGQRQPRVLAKRHDDGLLFERKNRRFRNGWTGPAVDSRFFHLATVFWWMP